MAAYVTFPGVAGNYVSSFDSNVLTADSAHLLQSRGNWNVGTISTSESFFGPSSLLVAGGASATLTPGTDAASFSVWVWSGSVETFDINGGAGVVVPSGVWTQLTAPGNAGTYVVNTAGATDYHIDAACLQASGTGFTPSLRIVGSLELNIDARLTNWDVPTQYQLSRATAYQFYAVGDGRQGLIYFNQASAAQFALFPAPAGLVNGARASLRCLLDFGAGNVKLFVNGVQEASTPAIVGTSLDPTGLKVDAGAAAGANPVDGDVFMMDVRDGIDGPQVAVFDALDAARALVL